MFERNVREVIKDEIGPDEVEIGKNGWLIVRDEYMRHGEKHIDYEPVYMVANTERSYFCGYYDDTRYYLPERFVRGYGYDRRFCSYRSYRDEGYLYRIYSSEDNAQKAIVKMVKEISELKRANYKGIKYATFRARNGFKICEAEATLIKAGTPNPFRECECVSADVWYLKVDGIYRVKCAEGRGVDKDLERAIFDTREEAEQHCARRNARVAELKKIKEMYSLDV